SSFLSHHRDAPSTYTSFGMRFPRTNLTVVSRRDDGRSSSSPWLTGSCVAPYGLSPVPRACLDRQTVEVVIAGCPTSGRRALEVPVCCQRRGNSPPVGNARSSRNSRGAGRKRHLGAARAAHT